MGGVILPGEIWLCQFRLARKRAVKKGARGRVFTHAARRNLALPVSPGAERANKKGARGRVFTHAARAILDGIYARSPLRRLKM